MYMSYAPKGPGGPGLGLLLFVVLTYTAHRQNWYHFKNKENKGDR